MDNLNDKELFDSALTDEAPETPVDTPAEQPAAEDQSQPRDEQGRFAPKAQAQPEAQPEPAPAPQAQPQTKDEAHVPSWRVREIREEADRRLAEERAHWQRQFAELQRQNQPRPEPQPAPDVFENPNAFLEHGVRQQVDPIKSELQAQREFMSRQFAESQHGADKVREAFEWIRQGMANRDPEALATYQRAMQSMHPFGELVTAHQQRTVYQQIGSDPQAWFGKTLDDRIASDPKFAGELLQKLQQSARQQPGNPQAQPNIKLPPSLSRVPAAQVATDDDNDVSDAALFRHAMR